MPVFYDYGGISFKQCVGENISHACYLIYAVLFNLRTLNISFAVCHFLCPIFFFFGIRKVPIRFAI